MSVKTFFDKIGEDLEQFLKKVPDVETKVSAVLSIVSPLVESVAAVTVGEAAAADIAQVVAKSQQGLATVGSLASAYNIGEPTTMKQALTAATTAVTSNLSGILASGQVKNEATAAKVTSIVGTVANEFEAILKAL